MNQFGLDPDFDPRIADWLEDDPDRAPDAVLETVIAALPSIPQRRVRVPWRFQSMIRFAQLGTVAAIVVVAGLIILRPGTTNIGAVPTSPPTASPTASPPTSPPTPSPSPSVIKSSDSGRTLNAGTYRVDGFAVPLSVTLPGGWVTNGFTPHDLVLHNETTNAFLTLVVMGGVYRDPCHPSAQPTTVRPGADALVDALSTMKKFTVTGRQPVTIGGASGTTFTLSNTIDLTKDGCARTDVVWIGTDADGAPVLETAGGGEPLSVVEVGTTTVLIGAPTDMLNAIAFGATP